MGHGHAERVRPISRSLDAWTTNLLSWLNVSRDDLSLWVAKWAAFVVALAPMGADVTKFGIPAKWVPYIQLVAVFVSVSSAQHRTSALPGAKNEVPPPDLSRL